jgi:hypothetical protein
MNIGEVVTGIFQGLVDFLNVLVSWIPNSPFREFINSLGDTLGSEFLGYLNYFLPISELLVILTAWVNGILVYYTVSIILRWVKAVS